MQMMQLIRWQSAQIANATKKTLCMSAQECNQIPGKWTKAAVAQTSMTDVFADARMAVYQLCGLDFPRDGK